MGQFLRGFLFLLVGFYVCGILTILPLTEAMQWYRPQWMLMFVIFSQISLPFMFNPCVAWFVGLLMDSLLGTQLGEHALVFSAICYITYILRPKFTQRPLWSQIEKVFLLVCLSQIAMLWLHVIAGQNPRTLFYWMGSVMSCAVWPLFALFFQAILSHVFCIAPLRTRSL